MNAARRWYIYLVCAISLQAVTWAVVALLRNLLAQGGGGVASIAFQIATILIALPIFLVHWLWAQRLAVREVSEREAGLRGLYHYGMMAGFLGPIIANTYSLFHYAFWLAAGRPGYDPSFGETASPLQEMLYYLIAIIVCALLWFYQQRVAAEDSKSITEGDNFATVRRLYLFVFSAWGLIMTTLAVIHIIRWIMFQFGSGNDALVLGGNIHYLLTEVARLMVGVPLWLVFWRQAQNMFSGLSLAERESALRKFYLYTTVFVAALSAVTNMTLILAGLLRRVLALPSQGDIRTPLPIILGMAILWAYHAFALREDAARASESVKQGGVRRLYLYLIAGVGLAAFLVGLSGDISVLIRLFSQPFVAALRESLAWFTAALITGLPVWLIPWRQAQLEAVALTPEGVAARRSVVRKIYLYFYLFVATMTVLSSAVYVLYRLLSLVLGERGQGNLATGIAQAVAYAVVGVLVWLYHGSALRGDGDSNRRELAQRLKDVRVAIVDTGGAGFGQALLGRLQQEEPTLNFELVTLPAQDEEAEQAVKTKLETAGVIVGPWFIALDRRTSDADVAHSVVNSPARKIMIPVPMSGWDWAGVDAWNAEELMQQTVRAVRQWAGGEEIKAVRPMTIGGIIGTVIGVLILLILLVIPVLVYFTGGF
jgi:hypothetical protein